MDDMDGKIDKSSDNSGTPAPGKLAGRLADGTFAPGCSGNPSGSSKAKRGIDIARGIIERLMEDPANRQIVLDGVIASMKKEPLRFHDKYLNDGTATQAAPHEEVIDFDKLSIMQINTVITDRTKYADDDTGGTDDSTGS